MIENSLNEYFKDTDKEQKDFIWQEYTLEELNLPSADKILQGVKNIEKQVGLVGWREKNYVSDTYKGFGLTYNPDFFDDTSRYHQVFGSPLLHQSFSRGDNTDIGDHKQIVNTYYDSFGFRKIDNLIYKELGLLLDRFRFPIIRSRVAYIFGHGKTPTDKGWHLDEPTNEVLRLNIPLQTSDEYAIEVENKTYILEVGKVYLWNTRLPHRPTIVKKVESLQPRINIVLGISPWLNYDKENDSFSKNEYFGKPVNEIVKEKLFVK